MKILYVPYCYYPDSVGGTEVYVAALARLLLRRGIEGVIAAPASQEAAYLHEGIPVRRFPIPEPSLCQLYGEWDPRVERTFAAVLEQERPDLVHLHAYVASFSGPLLRAVKARGIPVVFTYHTPAVSCQRGTMMWFGEKICDGIFRLGTCTRCSLHREGVPRGLADLVASVPASVGKALGRRGLAGGAWTALRMRALLKIRGDAFREFIDQVDHVVAVSGWVQDVLIHNGVDPTKITVSRQGLPHVEEGELIKHPDESGIPVRDPAGPLRMIFVGRLVPMKGAHIIVRALRDGPHLNVKLDIYGNVPRGDEAYLRSVQRLALGDPRIRFLGSLHSEEVVGRMRQYDLLVVPSRWLETGPLVVLEAYAAGIPVLGSNLIGIPDLVSDGVNGLLVSPVRPESFLKALERICREPELLQRLRAGVRPPRSMETVSREMEALYRKLLEKARGELAS